MNAEASVETISRANVLVVPAAAVQSSGGNKLVSVVDGSTTTPTIVAVGASNGTYVEITSGLNEGDVIAYSAGSDGSANANLGMMMMGGDIGGMPGGQMPSGNWSGGTRGSGTRSSGSGDAGSRPASPGGN
ncbi:MAG: efflux RND transporter periplasmic adaptor subunit, partial [Clostridiales bacterium]|nr:efflux RND transporter periplasmic adaptor subunit [Clostridiales bacterium]